MTNPLRENETMSDDEAREVVTSMAGGANVGPRFLSLARLVVDLGDRVHRLERQGLLSDAWHAITALRQDMHGLESTVSSITQGMADEEKGSRGLTVEERDAYRRTRARLFKPFEPDSQSSTRTPGISADMEQADGERERPTVAEGWADRNLDRYVSADMRIPAYDAQLEREELVKELDRALKAFGAASYAGSLCRRAAAALRSSAQKDGEQGDGLLEALLDSEPRYTDNPHSIGMAPVRCAYCDAKLGDRGRSYAIDDHDWDCTWVWLIGLAHAPVQPSSAPVTPEERVERAKGCWSGGEKAQRDEQAGDSAPSNPDRIPAQPVAQEGKEADEGERLARWCDEEAQGHRRTLEAHNDDPHYQLGGYRETAAANMDAIAAALRSAQPAQPVAPSQMKAWLDPKLDYYASADFRAPPAPSEIDEDAHG